MFNASKPQTSMKSSLWDKSFTKLARGLRVGYEDLSQTPGTFPTFRLAASSSISAVITVIPFKAFFRLNS